MRTSGRSGDWRGLAWPHSRVKLLHLATWTHTAAGCGAVRAPLRLLGGLLIAGYLLLGCSLLLRMANSAADGMSMSGAVF